MPPRFTTHGATSIFLSFVCDRHTVRPALHLALVRAIRLKLPAQCRTSPPKANRRWKNCFSPALYRGRNAIERMFCRLKDFRRIATRYDRLATKFSPPFVSRPPSATGYQILTLAFQSEVTRKGCCAIQW